MNDPGIIRNRLKIEAVIYNAQKICVLQNKYGSFKHWLDIHVSLKKEEWINLFKKTFRFTGGEITHEFLKSTGYLNGAHKEDCPIYHKIKQIHPI